MSGVTVMAVLASCSSSLGARLERQRSDDEQRARAGADDVRAAT